MNDGRKKKQQKHQNKTAFKIQFNSLALQIHKKVSLNLLCKRCSDQINWKVQFNKYKKITQAGKCNFCTNKVVVRSYMKACDPCAQKQKVCPKCLSTDAEILEGDQVKLNAKQQALKDKEEQKAMNDYIDSLRQRSKRKIKREYEKGIITWDSQNKYFVDNQGNQLVGLKFKTKGIEDLEKQMYEDDDDNFWQDQDCNQEQIEQKDQYQNNKNKNTKKNVNESKKQVKNEANNNQQQEQNQEKDEQNEDQQEQIDDGQQLNEDQDEIESNKDQQQNIKQKKVKVIKQK